MPRNLVLFDLEWNIGYQPYTFNYHGVQQTFRGEIVDRLREELRSRE